MRVAPAMSVLSRLSSPLVWLLDARAKLLLRLLGQHGDSEHRVNEEEVRTIIRKRKAPDVLESEEKRDEIAGVMRLADRTATGLMTPRRDVEILDLTDEPRKSSPNFARPNDRACQCRTGKPTRSWVS